MRRVMSECGEGACALGAWNAATSERKGRGESGSRTRSSVDGAGELKVLKVEVCT